MQDKIVQGQHVDPVKLQRAKELRRQMTPAEAMLWAALRTNKLRGYHFRRQQVVAGFILDFYCHAAGLAIEVDGSVHQSQGEYDAERDRVLAEHGLRILRFSNDEVRTNLAGVLSRLAVACAQHVASGTTT